jgi:anti-sigma factor RsiW
VDCDEFVELVTAYLDGALDAETQERFVAHIHVCDGCDVYLGQIREMVSTVGQLEPDHLSAPARDTLLTAFRNWHRP